MLNPFIPRKSTYKPRVLGKSDIITIEVKDKIKKITDDKTKTEDYVIDKVVEQTSVIDAKEYVQSFADDVGIENILKKVALTNDLNLINQRVRPTGEVDENGYEKLQDYVDIPNDALEADQIVKDGKKLYETLPAELVNNKSFKEFAETATPEELQAYVLKQLQNQNKNVKKEGAE